jgi:pyruvate,water dikinase
MKLLLRLEEAGSAGLAGGKGHGLHLLRLWGLNVPHAVILSTAAYRDALASPSLAALVRDADDHSDPARTGAVRSALLEARLPAALEAALDEAWTEVGGSPSGSVSCRSSATVEDSRSRSFAGQFATVLGVRSAAALKDAVRHCWASAWTAEAAAYRQRAGVPASEVGMAVVIQRMVRADVSGVAFSINPVTEDSSEVMINASWGLGETVVSGLVTPDTFIVDKASLQVVGSDISTGKGVMHVLDATGVVVERTVDAATAASRTLSDAQAAEVARLAIRAESQAGTPQDVEWAIAGGELVALQARPVTAAF